MSGFRLGIDGICMQFLFLNNFIDCNISVYTVFNILYFIMLLTLFSIEKFKNFDSVLNFLFFTFGAMVLMAYFSV